MSIGHNVLLKDKMTNVRCLVSYYAILNLKYFLSKDNQVKLADILEDYTPVNYLKNKEVPFPPVPITNAGKDAPAIKKGIQEFVNESFKANILIDFSNHPEGFHGFDVLNDDDRTKDIIKTTIQFIHPVSQGAGINSQQVSSNNFIFIKNVV